MNGPTAIGVDVGGTKIAAGLVDLATGAVLSRRRQATEPRRGGQAVLDDVIAIAASLKRESQQLGRPAQHVGVGLPELVAPDGDVLSGASFDWSRLGPCRAIGEAVGLPVRLEADVRAAARAEATYGAGVSQKVVLYVTVGTGVSACLVIDGDPYVGARGLTGTFASSPGLIALEDGQLAHGLPLEAYAAGPAIADRYARTRADGAYAAPQVVERCEGGDRAAKQIITTAGEALGAAIGQLVNVLDPSIVVLGGGMGLVEGAFREAILAGLRRHVWSELHRDLPVVSAALGADAGLVGAALTLLRT